MLESITLFIQEASNPIEVGIGVIIIIVLLVAGIRALQAAIGGGILGAIIGPIFLGVTIIDGATGGALVFGILGFFSAFTDDEKK